ncbi:hypothetical protein GGX14DRAFT_634593 [Mycena pura]|uniref:Uncharacterized protein n=1 Tax=Mycena pura TaxID=153505 RepID=A0AAD6VC35_9AGAR|nr:hypothetical protein GGX14DRAFT_634593 [Mycena pura]
MSEFSTNAAEKSPKPPKPPKPPIWAHLYCVDKWAWFCGDTPAAIAHESPELYSVLNTIKNSSEERAHRKLKNAADAIALICATARDASSVSACAIETSIGDDGEATYTIRISQNSGVSSTTLKDLRSLLNGIASKTDECNTQDELRALKDSVRADIVVRSEAKIRDVVTADRMRFSGWCKWPAANPDLPLLSRLPPAVQDTFKSCISRLCNQQTSFQQMVETADIFESMIYVLDLKAKSESLLAAVSNNIPDDIRRYVSHLARYSTAAEHVVECFKFLRRTCQRPSASTFTVQCVPLLDSLRLGSAADDEEPINIETYLRDNFNVPYKSLLPNKGSQARDSWTAARNRKCSFLHTELQLAMFYCLNPDLLPVAGYIGVSKRCCGLCAFVLKALQKDASADARYSVDIAGPPLLFSVRGTHGGLTTQWTFPDITRFPNDTSISDLGKAKLQKRLDLIRDDLSMELKGKHGKLLGLPDGRTLDQPGYFGVHAIGEVWKILWVVEQNLIAKHGFTDSLFPPALPNGTVPEGDFTSQAQWELAHCPFTLTEIAPYIRYDKPAPALFTPSSCPPSALPPTRKARRPVAGNKIENNDLRPHVVAADHLRIWTSPFGQAHDAEFRSKFPDELVNKAYGLDQLSPSTRVMAEMPGYLMTSCTL